MHSFAIDRATAERLKGLAILLMLAHHLFGLPGLIEPPNAYVALIPGVPLEYWIGRFGKICVAMFLLLSGYGFARAGLRPWRYFAGKAWRFLLAFWPYFLIAFAVGSLFFQERLPSGYWRFPRDPVEFVLNALTLRNSMAFEWWFAETYLLLVLTTPLLLRVAGQRLVLLGGSCALFVLGSAMDLLRIDVPLVSLANLLIWQWPWVVGMLLAGELPRSIAGALSSRRIALIGLAGITAGFALVERFAGFAMTPFVILAAPALVVALVTLTGNMRAGWPARALGWLGGLTLGLWLVHPFFCYYFFQDAIYAPRWSPLVFAALLGASLAVVLPVEAARRLAGKLIHKGRPIR